MCALRYEITLFPLAFTPEFFSRLYSISNVQPSVTPRTPQIIITQKSLSNFKSQRQPQTLEGGCRPCESVVMETNLPLLYDRNLLCTHG